jgi:DNA-binding CsgD family transcriptional regulator
MDPMTLDASILEQLFGLTPTECEVAFALLEHDKLVDIAVVRNVSIETIRMHVKNIFVKTGMSSQKKLLSLLTRIHAMSSNSN